MINGIQLTTPSLERWPVKHEIVRVRHELRRRSLTVQAVRHLTPRMLRVTLEGDELADFISLSPDDHIKLFVPGEDGEVARRDYTPRHHDERAGELTIDFALHDAGPATRWAREARPGSSLEIAGPRGSAVVPLDFDWWLLIGDETALPAIGRRIEELPVGTPVTSIVAVVDEQERQQFAGGATHRAIWAHRPTDRADDAGPLLDALAGLSLPEGDGFVWIAAEAQVARAVRRQIVEILGHPPQWLRASGYWLKGAADAHESLDG